ncbi:MAG: hypothetical protein ACI4S3_10055 [Candidatus Gastranaerophilaceae bacterium]
MITEYSELISFDIFDTLVTRRVANSKGIFQIMEYILENNSHFADFDCYIKNNFTTIRQGVFSELTKQCQINKIEPTLEKIYERIGNHNSLTEEQQLRLLNLELKVEKNNIIPIVENIEILKKYLSNNQRVILISDMYLSSFQIRDIISSVNDIFKDIPIEVSSELGATKQTGDIYSIISKKYNIDYKNWTHYGDNLIGDISNCKKYGIKTNICIKTQFQPYEESILKNQDDINSQVYIGCAKNSLDRNYSTEAYKLGCSFAAPILYSYIKFVLNSAIRQSIKTLYFIARDGYVLKFIADEIIKSKKLNIKTSYIYGSRKAFRTPNINEYEDFIRFMLNETDNMDDLYIDDVIIQHPEIKKLSLDKDKSKIKALLLNNSIIKEKILNNFKQKRGLLSKYIKQEVNFSENFAFVDLCGTGKSQDYLQSVINEFDSRRITTFYFYNSFLTDYKTSKKISYLTNIRSSLIMELLARCPQGQTVGYSEEDGHIKPIIEKYNSELLIKWGFNDYIGGIKRFVQNIVEFENKNNIEVFSLKMTKSYVASCNLQNIFLCKIIGSIPAFKLFGSEQDCEQEIASPYKLTDLFKAKDSKVHILRFARSSKIIQFLMGRKKIVIRYKNMP